MQFNSNSPSVFGRVRSVASALLQCLSGSPAEMNTNESVDASNSNDELNNGAESLYTNGTAASSSASFTSSDSVASDSQAVEPIASNAARQDSQHVGHAEEASHATVQSNANFMDSVTLRLQHANNSNAARPGSLRRILNSPEPQPASSHTVHPASGSSVRRPPPSPSHDARIENFMRFEHVIMGRERNVSSHSPSSSAYHSESPSPEPRVGRLVPATFNPLRPLNPRSYGGFRSTSSRPVPAGYRGEARALPPSFQRAMPHGLVRQNAYQDINVPHHPLESAVPERTQPAPREQWWHYVAIVKDDSDSSESGSDSDSPFPRSYPRPCPSSRHHRPYDRHRAPSPPSPRRRQPTPGPSRLSRSHNVSDDERQSLEASAHSRRARRATPYPSPSFSNSESESDSGSRPSASMFRRPNPQTARASVERRRSERESLSESEREVKRESVSGSEREVKKESMSPPPLSGTNAAPSISTYRPSAAALVKAQSSSPQPRVAGPSRRSRSPPRLSPYSVDPTPREEVQQEQGNEEVSASAFRRSARLAARKRDEAKQKGKGKATDA